MKKLTLLLFFLFVPFSFAEQASPLKADQPSKTAESDQNPYKFYFLANIGYAEFSGVFEGYKEGVGQKGDLSLGVGLGYQLTDEISFEAGHIYLGEAASTNHKRLEAKGFYIGVKSQVDEVQIKGPFDFFITSAPAPQIIPIIGIPADK